ncbi:MAG: glycosyltransferase [Propionibacteriaceae bacterium]|jgi:glycosyltransferase involved in cell wall biosynthesis|nr:glycosyltransferase [Propionibacteriaceae bacterium]
MRIGLFTDSYRPASNGIVYSIDIMRRRLTELGHDVHVFAPGERHAQDEDDHLVRVPAITGVGFSESQLSLFFPPRLLRQIEALELDLLTCLTPGQLGLMSAWAARKTGLPLVAQHTTDVYEYSRSYNALSASVPLFTVLVSLALKLTPAQKRQLLKNYAPGSRAPSSWTREAVGSFITMLYGNCDAVVTLSPKSSRQLAQLAEQFQTDLDLRLIPTGVDPLPVVDAATVQAFRQRLGLAPDDEVALYAGRLAQEKNLDLLIAMAAPLLRLRPQAKLVLVGDFDHRSALEKAAAQSEAAQAIVFAGRLPREELGQAYQAADVFVFPSLTDTQGLVLNEAAHAGLPMVLIDTELSGCFIPGGNGLAARDEADDFARQTARLLADPALRAELGARSRSLAAGQGELAQTKALADLYAEVAARHQAVSDDPEV